MSVRSKLGDDERGAASDDVGNEGEVTRQTVELRDGNRRLGFLGQGEGGGQLWPAVECVGALAGFDLYKLSE